MVYSNKLVVVLKNNGKILREYNNTNQDSYSVKLPFGSEYSLHFKNLDTRDCVAKISIDGQDVMSGSQLIIRAEQETSIEGFLKGNTATNKFKFIEKTKQISDYRGDKIDDGLITIKYCFTKPVIIPQVLYRKSFEPNITLCSYSCSSDRGITVPGSKIEQEFNYSNIGPLDNAWNSIIIQLIGETNSKILTPEYTTTKITCPTCGKKHKNICNFCNNCGTSLI